jgi:hypothetical protein
MGVIRDPEVQILAALSQSLEPDYVGEKEKSMWEGSPFYWIKTRPSRQVGAIGEALVAGWAASKGFDVVRAKTSDHDREIAGLKVEIKFSTLWTDNEIFKFQQLRDQDYDYCFCIGVAPFDAQAWFVPKAALAENRPPHLVPQHGGAAGQDTKWLSFASAAPPDWLDEFGGRLSQVADLIALAAGLPPVDKTDLL